MKLDDIRGLIISSDREVDWNDIEPGPYFTDAPDVDEKTFRWHTGLIVYRHDVRLSIQWGMEWGHIGRQVTKATDLWDDAAFPDEQARVELADIFWAGALVDRERVVVVDGGRGLLPLGERHALNYDRRNPPQKVEWEYSASRWQTELARLLDGGHDFDQYFRGAGLVVKG